MLSEIGICSWLSRGHNSLFGCFDPQFDPLALATQWRGSGELHTTRPLLAYLTTTCPATIYDYFYHRPPRNPTRLASSLLASYRPF